MDEATAKYIQDLEARLHQEIQVNQSLQELQGRLHTDLKTLRDELASQTRALARMDNYKRALEDIAKTKTKSGEKAKEAIDGKSRTRE